MALNIKNEETVRLANQLAKLTGESLTKAVTEAIRERIRREETPEHRLARLTEIAKDCAKRLGPKDESEDPTAFLYDERGLPA